MTAGFSSTAVVGMCSTWCVKRVIAAAPRPSCTAAPAASASLSRHNIHAIMRCTYSSTITRGLPIFIAPCTHGVPRCR